MITSVRANRSSFRTVTFQPGFNVVLADRTQDSTKKDSRNGLGKSTLIEILHFALGSKPEGLEKLAGWEFTVGLRLAGRSIDVTRAVDDPKRIALTGDIEGISVGTRLDVGRQASDTEWIQYLGQAMFGLPAKEKGDKWTPTYRSLISYFIRRGKDAFSDPFGRHRQQQEWDKQVANAFLLGLAWEDAQAFEDLRQKDKALDALRKAARAGVVDGLSGKLGELDAERVLLVERADQEQAALKSFRVHPQYREIETQASALTEQIHDLSNENVSDRNLIGFYRQSLEVAVPPDEGDVVRLYEEAGTALPEMVKKRLDDVRSFHAQLVDNRRAFLHDEMQRLELARVQRDDRIKDLTAQRAELLAILRDHGALEEHSRLQRLHLSTVEEIRKLETRIGNLRKVEKGKSDLTVEREHLLQRTRSDYDARGEIRRRAIKAFASHSEALYSEPGTLVIEVAKTGFKFDVEIPRAKSAGVANMKIFCYDLTLAELWAGKQPSPGMLVHDSLIFDGVDERQVAQALQRAAKVSGERGFQYICTINSDAIHDAEFEPGFDLSEFVRLRLTDESPEGRLLGVQF